MALAGIDIEIAGEFLGHPGQRAGFLVLAGLLGGFLVIRTSTRLIRMDLRWWPGNIETAGGLHIHHLVIGIVTIMGTGFAAFAVQPSSPWVEVLAVAFGVGCGLTLDEFALWLRLEDVYWSAEGRASIDAVIVAMTAGTMLALGIAPFDPGERGSLAAIAVAVALNLAVVGVVVAKGKQMSAVLGAFVPLVAVIAAVRLARPRSPWARRRYPEGGARMRRAVARDRRVVALGQRFTDLIGGRPSGDGDG